MKSVNYSLALNPYLFDSNAFNKNIEDRKFHTKTIRFFNLLIQSAYVIFKKIVKKTSSVSLLFDNEGENNGKVNSGQETSFHLLAFEKFKDVGVSARSLLEVLKTINVEKDVAVTSRVDYRREFQLYSSQNYSKNNKVKKKKTKRFLVKVILRRDELDLNIDGYLKISPKFYLNDTNNDKFIELLKLVDKSYYNSGDNKIPEIDVSSILMANNVKKLSQTSSK
jgi:hypothetical protein